MNLNCTFIPMMLFIISMLGMIINSTNIILVLMCMELMLLSLSLNLLINTYMMDLMCGQFLSIYIMTVAAVESAMGLSMMIVFYKLKGSLSLKYLNLLKG